MKKTSMYATRTVGSKPFYEFVVWCVGAKGSCGESDALAYIADTYKREYVMRHGARDCARIARRDSECPEKNVGVRFLEGCEISEKESERLYTRGLSRLFNDLRSTCKRKSKSVSYCRETKTFVPAEKRARDVR